MRVSEFEELVSNALDDLPPTILEMLENVSVVVQEFPTREQMRANGLSSRYGLLGLYEGTPLTERGSGYGMVLPDKITIFKGPLEAVSASQEALAQEVRDTVVHELAHHFGIGDQELEEMGY